MDNGVDRELRSVNPTDLTRQRRTQKSNLPRPEVAAHSRVLNNIKDRTNRRTAGPAFTPLTRLAKFKAIRDRNLRKAGASAKSNKALLNNLNSEPMALESDTTNSSEPMTSATVVKATSHLSNGNDNLDHVVSNGHNGTNHLNSFDENAGAARASESEALDNGTSSLDQNNRESSTTKESEAEEAEMPILTQEAPYSDQQSSPPAANSSATANTRFSEFFSGEMSRLDREIGDSDEEQVLEEEVNLVIEDEIEIVAVEEYSEEDIEPGSGSSMEAVPSSDYYLVEDDVREENLDLSRETGQPSMDSSSEEDQSSPEKTTRLIDPSSLRRSTEPASVLAASVYSRIQVRPSYRTPTPEVAERLKRKASDDGGSSSSKRITLDGSQPSPGWRFFIPNAPSSWFRRTASQASASEAQQQNKDGPGGMSYLNKDDQSSEEEKDQPKSWLSTCKIM